MKNYNDIAVIMKKIIYDDNTIEYIPLEVIEGTYEEENNAFIDFDGTPYHHIIEDPDTVCFMYRDSIINYKKSFPYLTTSLLKFFLLNSTKKYN